MVNLEMAVRQGEEMRDAPTTQTPVRNTHGEQRGEQSLQAQKSPVKTGPLSTEYGG